MQYPNPEETVVKLPELCGTGPVPEYGQEAGNSTCEQVRPCQACTSGGQSDQSSRR